MKPIIDFGRACERAGLRHYLDVRWDNSSLRWRASVYRPGIVQELDDGFVFAEHRFIEEAVKQAVDLFLEKLGAESHGRGKTHSDL